MNRFFLLFVLMLVATTASAQTTVKINSAQQLADFAMRVNGGETALNAILTADIDFTSYPTLSIADKKLGAYKGTFDGDNYTVTIAYDFPAGSSYNQNDCFGLFGFVTKGAVVKNLNVTGSISVECNFWHVGGIIGGDNNAGGPITVTNCRCDVDINAVSPATTTNTFISVGGLMGTCQAELLMDDCSFRGSIVSESKRAGVGQTSYVAGLVGASNSGIRGHLTNCYVFINATTTVNAASNANRIAPIYYRTDLNKSCSCSGNYYYFENIRFNGADNAPFAMGTGDGVDIKNIDANATLTLVIDNATDMELFASLVNRGCRRISGKLTRCFAYSGPVPSSSAANAFMGSFDGQNHTITLSVDRDLVGLQSVGLFGYLGEGAQVRNLIVAGTVSGSLLATEADPAYMGAIAGCVVGSASVTNCMSTVELNNKRTTVPSVMGGLVGRVDGSLLIESCSFSGKGSQMGEGVSYNGFIGDVVAGGSVSFSNSYSMARNGGSVFAPESTLTVQNCYYRDNLTSPVGTAMPMSRIISGEMCYLLNGSQSEDVVWYQQVGSGEPHLAQCSCSSAKNYIVYKNEDKYCPDHDEVIETTYDNKVRSVIDRYNYPNHKFVYDAEADTYHCQCGKVWEYDEDGNYVIWNGARMKQFVTEVNVNNKIHLNAVLLRDIDYTAYTTMADMIDKEAYDGTFDGQYHKLTMAFDVNVNRAALFRHVGGATIKNLVLDGTITTRTGQDCGSLVGYNVNKPIHLENILSTVDLIFYGRPQWSGGIVNRAWEGFTLNNCGYHGRFINRSQSKFRCCGGLVGATNDLGQEYQDEIFNETGDTRTKGRGYFYNCYADVTRVGEGGGTADMDPDAAWQCYNLSSEGVWSIFENCYYTESFGALDNVGNRSVADGLANGAICYYLNEGVIDEEASVWFQKIGEDECPRLRRCSCGDTHNDLVYIGGQFRCPMDREGEGASFSNDPLLTAEVGEHLYDTETNKCIYCGQQMRSDDDYVYITSEDILMEFIRDVNAGKVKLNAVVTRDLDLTKGKYRNAMIGNSYQGVFDGGYNTIKIDATADKDYFGLFGTVSNAMIRNLMVEGKINANGKKYIGGIIGRNYTRKVTLENCLSTVVITTGQKDAYVGGLIGSAEVKGWSVNNCAYAGKIIATKNDARFCNGMVGFLNADGSIQNSHIYASIQGNINMQNCFTFAPTGATVGITNSYYLSKIGNANQGTARSDAEFRNGTVCNALNDGNNGNIVWYHYGDNPGKDYPILVGYVWAGKSSGALWSDASNWRRGVVPTLTSQPAYSSVIIPSGNLNPTNFSEDFYPHVTGTQGVKAIDIRSSAVVYVDGDNAKLNANTINNAGFLKLSTTGEVIAQSLSNATPTSQVIMEGESHLLVEGSFVNRGELPRYGILLSDSACMEIKGDLKNEIYSDKFNVDHYPYVHIVDDARLIVGGNTTNPGTMTIEGRSQTTFEGSVTTTRTLTVKGNAQVTFDDDLNINKGTFTLKGLTTMTTNGDINNSATLQVNYGDDYNAGADSPNFLINGSSPENVTVERSLMANTIYYTGSATEERKMNEGYTIGTDYNSYFDSGAEKFITSSGIARFQGGNRYAACTVGLAGVAGTSHTLIQKGTLHPNEAYRNSLLDGWNWLNNPYPFTVAAKDGLLPLDVDMPLSDDEGVAPTVWVRSNGGNGSFDFMTYNAYTDVVANGNDGAKYIAPFQDYCIYVNKADTYTFYPAVQIGENQSLLKASRLEMPKEIARLRISTDGKEEFDDEAVVVMRADGSMLPLMVDSYKYTATSKSQIGLFKEGSASRYAIGLYPEIVAMQQSEVNFFVAPHSSATTITISIDKTHLVTGSEVFLKDRLTGEVVDMNSCYSEYTIDATQEITDGRFALIFTSNKSLDINDDDNEPGATPTGVEPVTTASLRAYGAEGIIVVEATEAMRGMVIEIVDIAGRKVASVRCQGERTVIPVGSRGLYVTRLGASSTKVVVR